MTITVTGATIEAYLGHDSRYDTEEDPDVVINGEDIISLEISTRIGEVMDEFSLSLHNFDGKYSNQYELKAADRLEFYIPQSNGETWEWTGRIQTAERSRQSPDISQLDVSGVDYASDIISDRDNTNRYIGEDVGDIIVDVLESKVPEINPTAIGELGVETDINHSSTDCWDAIQKLAARADAVMIPDGQGIRVEEMFNLPYGFELVHTDFYEPPSISTDDDIKNIVRVDSGEERKLEGEQAVQDDYVTVNENNRLTERIRARKSQIHSIDVWVRKGSEDDSLKLRIQSDENGSPIAIGDEDSDIASADWQSDNITSEGWQFFNIPEHTLADRDPWVIIESDGETGHDIGVDSNGSLTYQSYYPFPINFEVQDSESIAEYGPREIQVDKQGIKTLTGARDAAFGELARRAWPPKSVEFEASSERAHYLEAGTRLDINRPHDGIEGEFIVTEVDTTWDSSTVQLQTSITADWRRGILAEVEN